MNIFTNSVETYEYLKRFCINSLIFKHKNPKKERKGEEYGKIWWVTKMREFCERIEEDV